MKLNAAVSENRFLGNITSSSIRKLLPRKHKLGLIRKNSDVENKPPIDSNIIIGKNEDLKTGIRKSTTFKERTKSSTIQDALPYHADPAVKVVVRIRPLNDERQGDWTLRRDSSSSLLVGDRKFFFDSVLDSNSSQDEVFQTVGVPLVKSALTGFNTSILSYGQTGSGKTYTMWGPPSAMVEGHSSSYQQGIVPRIFQMLFSEIHREQLADFEGKQKNFQCRCTFLEIYNENIGDLIDPAHRDLQIKDDPRNGIYVENLTEDYVASYEDVMEILVKGLSSRKVGATSINSKSSRSHVVFTCIIESWCKENSSSCFSSSRTSKITLVDLAGFDKNQLPNGSSLDEKEGKNVKKSLSQLGNLVKVLAEGAQSGKLENVPYKNSHLTHLLQESLGGNSKLSIICSISSDNRCAAETLSTVRFGQRARLICNQPVINEISEDDMNELSDQIHQLKEELIRAKSSANISVNNSGYFQGKNVRGSLNQLRTRLNRSLILPSIDNDCREEPNFNEDDIRELITQASCEDNAGKNVVDMRSMDEVDVFEEANEEISDSELLSTEDDVEDDDDDISGTSSFYQTDILAPTLSESPRIGTTHRKSSSLESSKTNVLESCNLNSSAMQNSLRHNNLIRSGPTESLAVSIQRGLQIIEQHSNRSSSVSFSFGHLALKPSEDADSDSASVQTSLMEEEVRATDGSSAYFLCAFCQKRYFSNGVKVEDSLKKWIVPVDQKQNHNGLDTVKEIAEATKREEKLEKVCMEQAAKIKELNHLVEHYKHKLEVQGQEIVPVGDLINKELRNEREELLGCNNEENHQMETTHEKYEIKEILEVVNHKNNATLSETDEKESLVKEIQSLRSKVQSYEESHANKSMGKLRSSLLSHSIQLKRTNGVDEVEFEKEKQKWMEMESDWISLTEELRMDLESYRGRSEKVERELDLEKKCSEELEEVVRRAVLGHARMVEHYADLQEKHNEIVEKHRAMMEGIAEVKKAAQKAGGCNKKSGGSKFAKALAAELSALRFDRERERNQLKKENKSLRIQLKDTAQAVHAAGELLVRLKEAEELAAIAEENDTKGRELNEKLKKQLERLKRKHKMEMMTMKQYLAESRLPESALQTMCRGEGSQNLAADDDEAWREEFGSVFQDQHHF